MEGYGLGTKGGQASLNHRESISIIEYAERNRAQKGEGVNAFSVSRYRQFARYIPREAQVIVDVGCNIGLGAEPLRAAAPSARLVGIDCVPERVAAARESFDEALLASATKLPLDTASVCVVTAGELIEHLTPADAERFVAEARRVLRPTGRMIITTPNPNYVKLKLMNRSVLDDPAHLSQFTAGELKRLLQRHEMRAIAIRGTGRVSEVIGTFVPVLSVYGSLMLVGMVGGG